MSKWANLVPSWTRQHPGGGGGEGFLLFVVEGRELDLLLFPPKKVLIRWFCNAWQVYGDEEWSFGFCEQGTGVFHVPHGRNPMYTYRECIVLGKTDCPIFKVNQILRELSREWPGHSYDLLSKNCNHFCDEFCERLGVPKLPGKSVSFSLSVFIHLKFGILFFVVYLNLLNVCCFTCIYKWTGQP